MGYHQPAVQQEPRAASSARPKGSAFRCYRYCPPWPEPTPLNARTGPQPLNARTGPQMSTTSRSETARAETCQLRHVPSWGPYWSYRTVPQRGHAACVQLTNLYRLIQIQVKPKSVIAHKKQNSTAHCRLSTQRPCSLLALASHQLLDGWALPYVQSHTNKLCSSCCRSWRTNTSTCWYKQPDLHVLKSDSACHLQTFVQCTHNGEMHTHMLCRQPCTATYYGMHMRRGHTGIYTVLPATRPASTLGLRSQSQGTMPAKECHTPAHVYTPPPQPADKVYKARAWLPKTVR